jgi:hypothetical protein
MPTVYRECVVASDSPRFFLTSLLSNFESDLSRGLRRSIQRTVLISIFGLFLAAAQVGTASPGGVDTSLRSMADSSSPAVKREEGPRPEPGTTSRPPAGPITADRPGFSTGLDTVPAGSFQTEAGYNFARAGSGRQHSLGEILVRYGLHEKIELRLGLNSFKYMNDSGAKSLGEDDPTAGLKLKLFTPSVQGLSVRPKLTLLLSTTIPAGSGEVGEPGFRPETRLILGWSLPRRMSLTANVLFASNSLKGERYGQYAHSVSLGWSPASSTALFLEYYGTFSGQPVDQNTKYFDAGISRVFRNRLQIDLWAGLGRNISGPEYALGLGIARRWRR